MQSPQAFAGPLADPLFAVVPPTRRATLCWSIAFIAWAGCGTDDATVTDPSGDATTLDEESTDTDTGDATQGSDTAPNGCTSSASCGEQVCDPVSGKCVDCLVHADCPATTDRCVADSCVAQLPCQSDKPCLAQGDVCSEVAGVCVACVGDADCEDGQSCLAQTCVGAPAACTSSKDCPKGQICDQSAGHCLGCLKDVDCNPFEYCWQSVCTVDACVAGTQKCQDEQTQLTCHFNGSKWDVTACGTGQSCFGGKCVQAVCTAKAKSCASDGGVQTCIDDGSAWGPSVSCPNGQFCLEGKCLLGVCTPGTTKCEGLQLATCATDGSAWKTEACQTIGGKPHACALLGGAAMCQPQVCTPNAALCQGSKVAQCNGTGTDITVGEDCALQSSGGVPRGCASGACVDPKCSPGKVICIDGQTVATCGTDGMTWNKQPCPSDMACEGAVCQPLICTPGKTSCDGDYVEKCNVNGTLMAVVEDCAALGTLCQDGSCLALLCTPKLKKCEGSVSLVCAADGMSWKTVACPVNQVCAAGDCLPVICSPGALSCDGEVARKCEPPGASYSVTQDCAFTGMTCEAGACKSLLCKPGETQCQLDQVAVCSGDGKKWNLTSCADADPCTIDSCDAAKLACAHSAPCDDGQVCTADACKAGKCANTPLTGPCTDGSACTVDESCFEGKCQPQSAPVVSTALGTGIKGAEDGEVAKVQFNGPASLARGPDGSLFIADRDNHQLRRMSSDGTAVFVVAGTGAQGTTDGPAGSATFDQPIALAVDAKGTVYIVEVGSRRIRRFTLANGVQTLAGSQTQGSKDGIGAAATFERPVALAIESSGNLLVSDAGGYRIRRVTPQGLVSTVAGGVQGYKDGPVAQAQFSSPAGLAVAPNGDVYVLDPGNVRVRRIHNGVVETVAGSTPGYQDGKGADVKFLAPTGLAWTVSGFGVVTDMVQHRLRAVWPDGTVTTLAGTGTAGLLNGLATQATFQVPLGVLADKSGVLLVADSGNHVIRRVVMNVLTCDDLDACTADLCNAVSGQCVFTPIVGPGCK
jgi:sugar lactone lactonase YvrE